MELSRKKERNYYDVEQEPCCARCGSTHYLLMEEGSKEIFCSPCWKALRPNTPQPPGPTEEAEKLDFYL